MKPSTFAPYLILGLIAFIAAIHAAEACTSFKFQERGKTLVARNFDWSLKGGYALINKRHVKKRALPVFEALPHPFANRAKWISRYGSVTFNYFGRNRPQGGINEAGLVVEMLMNWNVQYPKLTRIKPVLNELEWVQYQLDMFTSTEEVVEHLDEIEIGHMAKVHYLVCDLKECVTILPTREKLIAIQVDEIPALTNDNYLRAIEFLPSVNCTHAPAGDASLFRFARTSCELRKGSESREIENQVDGAFDILKRVSDAQTQVSVVYELESKTVHFKSSVAPNIKTLRVNDVSFSCDTPMLKLDLGDSSIDEGDITDSLGKVKLGRSKFHPLLWAIDKTFNLASQSKCLKSPK